MANYWETLVRFAENMVKKYPNIEDIEIFDAIYNKKSKTYDVKIGVYPYGVFFTSGTLEDLEEIIKDLNKEVVKNRYFCPFCYTGFSDSDIFWGKYKCKCGANIHKASVYNSSYAHDNDIFITLVKKYIEEKYSGKQMEFIENLLENYGYKVEDIFENVSFFKIDRVPTYAILGDKPVLKDTESIKEIEPLKWKFFMNGWKLVYINRRNDEEIWEKNGKKIGISDDEVIIECDNIVDYINFEEKTGEDFLDVYFEEYGEFPDDFIGSFPHGENIYGIFTDKEELLNRDLDTLLNEKNKEYIKRQKYLMKKYNYRQ